MLRKVNVKFAGDLEVVRGPGIAHGIEQIDAAAAGDGDQGIELGLFTHRLQGLEMHARQRSDDLQMAEFLGADVHQQIFAGGVFAIEALHRVLHRGG